jgi:hypothetical protein
VTSESKREHDLCHTATCQVLYIFRSLIREEEARDAYAEIYEIMQQEIRTYDRLKGCMHADSMLALQSQAESQARVAGQEGALPVLPAGDASAAHAGILLPDDVQEQQLNWGDGAGESHE